MPPRLALHVEQDVGAHGRAEEDAACLRLVRIAGLAVDRNNHRTMALEPQRHDAGERPIDEAQPDALASPHLLVHGDRTVERHQVADPAGHRRFHPVAEAGRDLPVRCESPVGEHPQNVAIDRHRLGLVDDQDAAEPATELLQAVDVRVIPECAGVRRRKCVDEALAGLDRRLGQPGHAIHGVGQPDTVPMDRRILVESVLDKDADGHALPSVQCRAGHRAVIGPHAGLRTVGAA